MKSKNKLLRVLALMLVCSMLLAACGGTSESSSSGSSDRSSSTAAESGEESTEREDITLTYFNPDPAVHEPAEDAPILQQLYEATGVKFDWDVPTSNAEERMNIMLATEELPDLINFSDRLTDATLINQFIEAGYLIDLAPLMKEHAPKTWANLQEILPKVLDEEGHLWFLPSGYTFPDSAIVTEAKVGFYSSSKYFDETGWESYPENFEEYENVLKEVDAETDMVPMAMALGANGQLGDVIEIGAGALGYVYSDYMILQDGELKWFSEVEEMKNYFKWLNNLYLQGLVDPESAIMSLDMLTEKVVSGQVWSFAGRGRRVNNSIDSYEKENGTTSRAASMWLKADDSVEKTTYAKYTENMITTGVAVTTACENPARVLEFYEYCNTEEGHLTATGIVNYDWDGTEEGEVGYDFVVTDEEYIEGRPYIAITDWSTNEWNADDNWWWNRGREMMWSFTYAADGVNHPDGQYDKVGNDDVSVWWDEEQIRIYNEYGLTGTNYTQYNFDMSCDISEFSGLNLDADSQEYLEYMDITQTIDNTLPKVILAESEADFEAQWEAFAAELSKQGLDHMMDAWNLKMEERVNSWEKNAQ